MTISNAKPERSNKFPPPPVPGTEYNTDVMVDFALNGIETCTKLIDTWESGKKPGKDFSYSVHNVKSFLKRYIKSQMND